MIIHVRNFGKIESADIDLSNLLIFVGENNSGKTYLMQLIYGLFSFLYSEKFNVFSESLNCIDIDEKLLKDDKLKNNKLIEVKSDDNKFYKDLQDELNMFIDKNKAYIIENTFHTNDLTIDSLSLEFKPISCDLSLSDIGEYERNKHILRRYSILKDDEPLNGYSFGFGIGFPEAHIKYVMKHEFMLVILSELTGVDWAKIHSMRKEKPFIYLPASRSGIMLLYANYLSSNLNNRKDEDIIIKNEEDIIIENDNDTENEFGLTEPVYEFLIFLLRYKSSETLSDYDKSILSFIDSNIINGHMKKTGNTMLYIPEKSDRSIPIYLSSSLVSEIAPIYQVLSSIQPFDYIMYDEIETCQHPTKQLQLARLLIRMVNAGYKMIVSTHSDTMAAAINNLITLSFKSNKNELISKLGYENDDILKSDNIKAYQFAIDEQGKTKVVELQSHFSSGIGFDFDLFNLTNEKIYQDAVELAEAK